MHNRCSFLIYYDLQQNPDLPHAIEIHSDLKREKRNFAGFWVKVLKYLERTQPLLSGPSRRHKSMGDLTTYR